MILIIDDDLGVRKSLSLLFRQNGYRTLEAEHPEMGLVQLAEHPVELVFLDMNFHVETTGDEGLAALKRIKEAHPMIPVILITGWGHMALAIDGMKAGAADFINKPWENDYVLEAAKTALKLNQSVEETSSDRAKLDRKFDFSDIIGEDPKLLEVLEQVARVAPTDASVLILGESGTGKELIAQALHKNSERRQENFVEVNLGGISASLFESEMFGHKKGAFTDAHADRVGRFEAAHNGTIFLDELGELPLAQQVKLLRVLQDRRFEVLGSSETKSVNVRVVSATNRDLAKEVDEERFREDLFYRINLITLHLPPLRERPGDIPLLAKHFLNLAAADYGKTDVRFAPQALELLKGLPFPGNIRELKNLVERALLLATGNELQASDIEKHLRPNQSNATPQSKTLNLEEMERELVERAMRAHRYKVAPAARALGISRNALYRRLEKFGMADGAED
ncbi:sigma-54-dependent Fis family transcriptional regulator [Cryomorphaceae bacterium]|nr:sigma-54-dependent Fis family transcriptional regulator [Cryomorphaceae bacterium]